MTMHREVGENELSAGDRAAIQIMAALVEGGASDELPAHIAKQAYALVDAWLQERDARHQARERARRPARAAS